LVKGNKKGNRFLMRVKLNGSETNSGRCFIILLLSSLCLAGCSHIKNNSEKENEDFKKSAEEKLGKNLTYEYNAERTYALIYKQEKESAQKPNPALKLIVYDLVNSKLLFEDNLSSAKAFWKNDTEIEVRITPGNISTENQNTFYGYIYNVKTSEKTDLKNNKQSINQ
jgi:hypothetical protein